MKPLDWILLVWAAIWILIQINRLVSIPRAAFKAGLVEITPRFYLPYLAILFVVWRVYG